MPGIECCWVGGVLGQHAVCCHAASRRVWGDGCGRGSRGCRGHCPVWQSLRHRVVALVVALLLLLLLLLVVVMLALVVVIAVVLLERRRGLVLELLWRWCWCLCCGGAAAAVGMRAVVSEAL